MKYILYIIFILVLACTGYGFYIKAENLEKGHLFIGIAVVLLFFVWMPVFIYHRWRNKNIKDYMLTPENLEKIRKHSKDKKL